MSKTEFNECPYLWAVTTKDEIFYAFAETRWEAVKEVEEEIKDMTQSLAVKCICFANDIVNYK